MVRLNLVRKQQYFVVEPIDGSGNKEIVEMTAELLSQSINAYLTDNDFQAVIVTTTMMTAEEYAELPTEYTGNTYWRR